MRRESILENQLQQISNLQRALNLLEDQVVLRSNKNIEDREYAISELRYYKKLSCSFFSYPTSVQTEIVMDMIAMIDEVELWLNE